MIITTIQKTPPEIKNNPITPPSPILEVFDSINILVPLKVFAL